MFDREQHLEWYAKLMTEDRNRQAKAADDLTQQTIDLYNQSASMRQALQTILDEARSSLPSDMMYADLSQYYRAKVQRIAVMADAALNK